VSTAVPDQVSPAVSTLADIGHVLESVEMPREQLQRALELLDRFVPYDRCALLDAASEERPRVTVVPAAPPDEREALRGKLVALHELVVDRPVAQRADLPLPGSEAGAPHLAVPLIALDAPVGILFVERSPEPYEVHHLQLLSVAAAQIGTYLAKARLQSEERRAAQAVRRVADLLEYLRDAFIEFDAEGICLSANPAAARLLDVATERIVGGDVRGLLDFDGSGAFARAAECVLKDRRPVQVPASYAPGRRRWYECDVYPNELGGSVIVRDITDRRDAEEMRDLFVGVIGHDLRTPLGAIMLSARALMKREGSSGRTGRTVARIADSAARMSEMVSQLLDLTRIRLGRGMPMHLRECDLGDICREAADELEQVNPTRKIKRRFSGDLTGNWDADRLIQVVSNLLDNAIQHGDPERPVRLSASASASAPETVTLDIHNHGPPIPPEMMPTLFHPFRQGAGERPGSSSLGLGLFIAHSIVASHGGGIEVESSVESGTRFRVRLPRGTAGAPGAAAAREGANGGGGERA